MDLDIKDYLLSMQCLLTMIDWPVLKRKNVVHVRLIVNIFLVLLCFFQPKCVVHNVVLSEKRK